MLGRAGLIVASMLAALLAIELGLRAFHPSGSLTKWSNLVYDARTVLARTESSRFEHDPRVGYVPRGGFRGNGVPLPAVTAPAGPARPIIGVGDSFTYGEEVEHAETWPAHLERRLARPVLNGGASGYGFDQTVLRAEILTREAKPAAIVVSLIADDIKRTEMRRQWGAEKPYFELQGEQLVPRNIPVPPPPDVRGEMTFWQRTLGYSFLVDFFLRRTHQLHGWFGDHIRIHPPGSGLGISCKLLTRLDALQKDTGTPVFLLMQYDAVTWQQPTPANSEQRHLSLEFLKCAAGKSFAVINSFDALARETDVRRHYLTWHMSNDGNRLIAGLIAETLARRLP